MCLPGKKNAGEVSEALVNNCIDFMPSICDWTGAEMPAGRNGASFRPYAEKGMEGPEYIVTETNFLQTSGTVGWMVRSAQYKYVLYDKGQYREMLYDMASDRGEMVNLAVESRYADIVKEHREVLRKWILEHSRFKSRHLRFLPE